LSRNRDLDAALKYHNGTKHSYLSLRAHPHLLDWQNKPLLFKIYPTLEVMRLPRDLRQTGVSALSAITSGSAKVKGKAIPDLDALAQLLFLSAGVTKSKKYPGGEVFFRAAACTGALYEIELYIVCAELPGLAAGVYHFGAAEFGLRLLRGGDYRDVVTRASGEDKTVARAPVIVICTGVYWRNAWKYRSRTYRHFGWDNGTILANMLAVGTSMGLPTRVITGFADSEINRLLDIDTSEEVAFSMVALGKMSGKVPVSEKHLEPLRLSTVPYSKDEVDYPAMRQMHTASSLSLDEVAAWREGSPFQKSPRPNAGLERPLSPISEKSRSTDTIEQVIQRRGSTRHFSRDSISLQQLSTILESSTRGIPADFLEPYGALLNDLYLIVNNVDGLPAGAYFFSPKKQKLELLKAGNFRQEAGYLGLEQQLPADAAVDIFFLADLGSILSRFGNRGYRIAQLEAGIIGGKLYLSAYAQGLGATGLTFYDDDVINFFSPEARGKSAIFLVAIGKSLRSQGLV
jgi:SagB-type dehydrogenase family enzyme